jgi:hypothetical protein
MAVNVHFPLVLSQQAQLNLRLMSQPSIPDCQTAACAGHAGLSDVAQPGDRTSCRVQVDPARYAA